MGVSENFKFVLLNDEDPSDQTVHTFHYFTNLFSSGLKHKSMLLRTGCFHNGLGCQLLPSWSLFLIVFMAVLVI